MTRLTVFYDGQCDFCCWCRDWLAAQDKYIDMEFLNRHGEVAQEEWADVLATIGEDELVVISDDGYLYLEDKAWIICLFALRNWRPMAHRLAAPGMAGLARRLFTVISRHRHQIPAWLLRASDDVVKDRLQTTPDLPRCAK